MKGYAYEGGIPYEVDLPTPPAGFLKFLDSLPCSCRGEAHDECREEDELIELKREEL